MSSSYYTFDYSNMGALSGPKGNNKQMKKNNFWVRNFVVIAVGYESYVRAAQDVQFRKPPLPVLRSTHF